MMKTIDRRVPLLACPAVSLSISSDAAVVVEVAAEVGFEGLEQAELDLLHFAELRFEITDAVLERLGVAALVGDLALLNQIPEQAHLVSPPI
jgi:hypothetical protein